MSTEVQVLPEGEAFTFQERGYVVLADCNNKAAPGHWLCVRHGEAFPHNLGMFSHYGDHGDCVMTWYCHAHGPEALG